jgi:hypothetical protein
MVDRVPAGRESQMDVVQDHGQDAQATQCIDAGETVLARNFGLQV